MYRCPECRTRRKVFTDMLRHINTTGHRVCTCGGYHFAHRPGTTLCHKNPASVLAEAQARGEPEEVLQEIRQWLAHQKPE